MPTSGRPSPSQATEDRYLTAAEVATILRSKPMTIVRLCRAGKLPATKPAGSWLISQADLQAHIEASRPERGAA